MAFKNQVIGNKSNTDKVKFLVTSEESKGELMRAELTISPSVYRMQMHYHPVQEETISVITGELNLICNGREIVLFAGESYTVPPNASHKYWNGSGAETTAIIELRPALKSEFYLETIYALNVKGKTNSKTGLPGFFQMAAMLNQYYGEEYVIGKPILTQKIKAKVIGKFAKLIGFKEFVPFTENLDINT